ncbi:HNH endonuclease [Allopontixanthobacter sediminis]|uniref:HNH nuclease domain-containing protein n=1 Tax=Allopontixanthobacter sediminis TaxID=1689985 RepID=A0A845AVD3_9SPHN|nr:hypothetical protein [Allopontixanthobacter sediminis]
MTAKSVSQETLLHKQKCTKCQLVQPIGDFPKDSQKRTGYSPRCKACKNVQSSAHYQANRLRVLRRLKDSYSASPERQKAYHKEWYQKNKERRSRQSKQWKAENHEAYSAQQREYASKRTEQNRERSQRWVRNNPEKARAIRTHHNSKRRSKIITGASKSDIFKWTSRQRKICFYCGKRCENRFEVDHFVPLAKGGAHEIDNLRISCRSCNRRKCATDPWQFLNRMGRLL